jgi:UPF0042 nucleotide-binding protein
MTDDSAGLVERSEAPSPKVVIVTGYSGSGKSTVVNALEDLGFFCIDNLPVPLLPKVLELAATSESRQQPTFAFVVDTREREFLDRAGETIEQLHQEGARVEIVFLEADDETLIRRYSQTRRPHPLSGEGTVRDGIARERELLTGLRQNADWIIDTTRHTPHTVKGLVKERFGEEGEPSLRLTILTFGFKHGVPPESDLVFDVRFLGNPYFVEELRELSGLDEDVRDYVLGQPETGGFLSLFRQVSDFLLPLYEREGKAYLTISIGCTGGQHRSVAVAEAIASRLRGRGWAVTVRHRDVRV